MFTCILSVSCVLSSWFIVSVYSTITAIQCMPCIFPALHNGSGEHWPQRLVWSRLVHVEILPKGAHHSKGSFQTPILCQVQHDRGRWRREPGPREVAQHQQVTSRGSVLGNVGHSTNAMDSFIGMILIPTISSDLKQLFPNAVFFPSLAAVRDSPD